MSKSILILALAMLLWAGFINIEADEIFGSSSVIDDLIGNLDSGEILVSRLEDGSKNLISGRAAGIIDAPVDRVWAVLSDYNNYQKFMPRLTETYMVDAGVINELKSRKDWTRDQFEALLDSYRTDEVREDGFFFYNVMDMPFPFPDFWFLLKMERNPSLHSFNWTMVYGNMLVNEGSWELKSYGEDSSKTIALYETSSDPGVYVPEVLQKLALKSTLPDIIKNLRRRVLQSTAGT
jgi:hypothetical protein